MFEQMFQEALDKAESTCINLSDPFYHAPTAPEEIRNMRWLCQTLKLSYDYVKDEKILSAIVALTEPLDSIVYAYETHTNDDALVIPCAEEWLDSLCKFYDEVGELK